ncbi:MAG: DUF1385 domain-containing protein [candidate division Zixibacteria bacterium CG_4_9_14_3_um_filter_46_8]|nr:MAG: DUF1385 domain-containing protein [candidate division Zixibacteria bacterium CG_4_9_14_3_um_filter_46_8]
MSFNVGGQAVIEGVMIRSAEKVSTAVRRIDGTILVKNEGFIPLVKRRKYLDIPLLRGAISFFEMLLLGIKTLNFSAEVAARDAEEDLPGKPRKSNSDFKGLFSFTLMLTAAAALGLGILVFFFTPLAITSLLRIEKGALLFNIVAGIIRMAMFILYVFVISKFNELKRIFEYHGAEHKSIYAYEAGQELTVSNARSYSTKHPRCGTSFILIVALFAIFTYSISDTVFGIIAGKPPVLWERFLLHFSLLPFVAGGSYELLKLSGKTRNHPVTAFLIQPGLWLQRITTKEPDDGKLEVALCALRQALGKEAPGSVIFDGDLKSVRIANESVRK